MAGQGKVSRLDDHIGYWMRQVSNHVSYAFARKLEGKGVTTAEWVLMRVVYDADALAPSRIAARMGMTRGAISKLADRLVEKGMLARQDNPDDGRGHCLSLTEAGRRLVPELARIADGNDEDCFRDLTATDRTRMKAMLKTIVEGRGLTDIPVD